MADREAVGDGVGTANGCLQSLDDPVGLGDDLPDLIVNRLDLAPTASWNGHPR